MHGLVQRRRGEGPLIWFTWGVEVK